MFRDPLLAHLAACSVMLGELTMRTDNAGEFGGSGNRRRAARPCTRPESFVL